MILRSSDLQSDNDLDSIRNSCDVFLALCQERVDPTQLDDFKLSQRLLETYPNLSVNIFD